jgi:hypothetical protein
VLPRSCTHVSELSFRLCTNTVGVWVLVKETVLQFYRSSIAPLATGSKESVLVAFTGVVDINICECHNMFECHMASITASGTTVK